MTIRADASAVLPDIQAARAGIEQSMAGVASSMQASMGAMEDATDAATASVGTMDPAVSEMADAMQASVMDMVNAFVDAQSQIENLVGGIVESVDNGLKNAQDSFDDYVSHMLRVQDAMDSVVTIVDQGFEQVGQSAGGAAPGLAGVKNSMSGISIETAEMSSTLRGATIGLRMMSSTSRMMGVELGALRPIIGGIAASLGYLRIAMTALATHPIIAAFVALAAVAMLVYHAFQKTGKSAYELKREAKDLADEISRLEKSQQKLVLRLHELSTQQYLTIIEQKEVKKIIAELESQYGPFGAEVDKTTGLITLQAGAFDKLTEAMNKSPIARLKKEYQEWAETLEAARKIAETAAPDDRRRADAAITEAKARMGAIKAELDALGAKPPELEEPGKYARYVKTRMELEDKFRKDNEVGQGKSEKDEEKRKLAALEREYKTDLDLAWKTGARVENRVKKYEADKQAIRDEYAEKRGERDEKNAFDLRQVELEYIGDLETKELEAAQREYAEKVKLVKKEGEDRTAIDSAYLMKVEAIRAKFSKQRNDEERDNQQVQDVYAAEQKAAWESVGESIRQSVMTRAEKAREEMVKIKEALAAKVITPETAERALRKVERSLKVELPRRLGLEDLGKQIQDALLKDEDEYAKDTAKNTEQLVKEIQGFRKEIKIPRPGELP